MITLFKIKISCKEVKTFPMIFFDEKYIGGYNETKTKIECFMDSND